MATGFGMCRSIKSKTFSKQHNLLTRGGYMRATAPMVVSRGAEQVAGLLDEGSNRHGVLRAT